MQQEWKKRNEFLLCVDSDGCAIDTMEIKHRKCFGPCLVEEWDLESWEDWILCRWNQINLYSQLRGINRFKALAIILKEICQKVTPIAGLREYCEWVRGAAHLSEAALCEYLSGAGLSEDVCFKKALSWSQKVNESIKKIAPEEKKAFRGVARGLQSVQGQMDIAVVSSANRQAVLEEWKENGLDQMVDVLFAQESGTKEVCIRKLIENGYQKQCILFVGDGPGDLDAAVENDISFYPILAGKEEQSWSEFVETAKSFLQGNYHKENQELEIKKFGDNLERG